MVPTIEERIAEIEANLPPYRPKVRYCIELDQIKHVPDYNRLRAEARFFLLKEFADKVERIERRRLGSYYRVKPAIRKFCEEHGVSMTSFFRWQRDYRRSGIVGLVPKFGNRRKRPAKGKHKPIELLIKIDPVRPLQCLRQILTLIRSSPEIPPEVANQAVEYLERELPLLKRRAALNLFRPITKEERQVLLGYRNGTHKNHRAKALALLMVEHGCTMEAVTKAAGRSTGTIYRWLRLFRVKGLSFIETQMNVEAREKLWRERTMKVVSILHEPPSAFGLNRTSWSYPALRQVYMQQHDQNLSAFSIKQIIHKAGYKWKRARKVLSSNDPAYKEKVAAVLNALHNLKGDEVFMFIDEAGPWRVVKYGGRALCPRDVTMQIPEVQIPKGKVTFIAGLEAVSNQVVWLYSSRKDTATVIRILEEIKNKYKGFSKVIVTWDALSSHRSAGVNAWIEQANEESKVNPTPAIEVVPLPANAQFLNVIESVFSGLRKAVIHNSDYQSAEEMKAAISRHFEERNAFYTENPKRAGNKIWDNQLFEIEELPGGLFRKM